MTSTTEPTTAHLAAAFDIAAQASEIDCATVDEFKVATLSPGRFDTIVSSAMVVAGLDPSATTVVREVLALVDDALAVAADPADAQGLTPIVAALEAAEIDHYVANTGGGVLVVEIPTGEYTLTEGVPSYDEYIGLTADPATGDDVCVVYYSAEAADGEAEPELLAQHTDTDGMLALVRNLLGADPFALR